MQLESHQARIGVCSGHSSMGPDNMAPTYNQASIGFYDADTGISESQSRAGEPTRGLHVRCEGRWWCDGAMAAHGACLRSSVKCWAQATAHNIFYADANTGVARF